MYLSLLNINPHSRQARYDLNDRYELHRTLMNAFAEDLPDGERILYRVEEGTLQPIVRILLQSQSIPNWDSVARLQSDYLIGMPSVREIRLQVEQRERSRFRLQANPTVKRNGKRHAIYKEDELLTWLQRKADNNGFAVDENHIRLIKQGVKFGKKRNQRWHAVQFDGVLTVQNVQEFQNALKSGIGSAKAFGFGLLSIPYKESQP